MSAVQIGCGAVGLFLWLVIVLAPLEGWAYAEAVRYTLMGPGTWLGFLATLLVLGGAVIARRGGARVPAPAS